MSGIFTVLIALELTQPAPAVEDRREIDSQYMNSWPGDPMTAAKAKLTDAFLNRSDPLSLALGERDISRAEGENERRQMR
jgi:hypothetical protein